MAERVDGGTAVELWDGWSLALPNDCLCERNADGSWSAWDAARTVDVQIVTVDATTHGWPMTADTMLGRQPNSRGAGWVGHVEELTEADERGEAFRLAIAAAAPNTLMSCWVAYRSGPDRQWANQVLATITFTSPSQGRGFFRRR